ncbi:hypothetical protein LTR10_017030 [Elasticomyces elasticus]|uniref:F-box domain-containing protein n=1 Tax=Exophiala sideris TaxID=1016849 RepID=A0ABR0IZ34_9EURO|nr:hypothetical protein LTR10_017030 [Elasticomyces elasticus]KAK5023039.1 hypothetical protein LTS07_009532 [Exophiala sideris]KAK5026764.1 hypothetical protein LTR13_009804 [Exophiala sideris]KAK5052417.1 hypothetical protein LTR69_009755 [Exophiala sideris]KAK5178202.1 hypothetical protein LTR44_009286 [Eurotiomycetes sp. CCFEE 6388]
MDRLPDGIVLDILEYLEPHELISTQKTSTALARSARDNRLWRVKCFEKSPSAAMRRQAGTLNSLTSALQGLTLSDRPAIASSNTSSHQQDLESVMRESPRARAVNEWDRSSKDEHVDWYSEYKARHAPLSAEWLNDQPSKHLDINGLATLTGSDRAVGYLDDGSVCVWDFAQSISGKRKFRQLGRSKPILFTDTIQADESLVIDCVSTFSPQQRAFIAIGNILNEVDLNTLRVVSHSKYAYPITALSQCTSADLPLTVGTQWSLHILDPRLSHSLTSQTDTERVEEVPAVSGSRTAILPDFAHSPQLFSSNFGPSAPFSEEPSWSPRVLNLHPSHHRQNPHWMAYARVEPGPLSILHHAENEILLAGRFPSILSYDRRYFPQLQYVIHSGASLSSLATIPHPPAGAPSSVTSGSTLVACGEYRGRGSLELYSLPHIKAGQNPVGQDPLTSNNPSDDDLLDLGRSPALSSDGSLFSYKNRQEAARSKVLSVASHGTKIVFSDSEGGLKWIERDGRSLVRKWNINGFEVGQTGASVNGDQVVRKIIPLDIADSDRGCRGDGDLLVWTGEKIGIVTTTPQYVDHEELVKELESGESASAKQEREKEKKAEEYSKMMRKALERQADERRWMSQFRLRRGYF